jgi:ATP-dependent exoDNAse (exonuclease V) alpha subunit
MQLPPCNGAQVFNQPDTHYPAPHLWRLFSLVELTENMRQQGDTRFADLLNALRVGKLNAQHLELLKTKMLKEATGEFAINKAIRVYPTRKLVAAFNQSVLDHYRAKGERMFRIRAQDQIIDARDNANINMQTAVPKDINFTGGYPAELEIFVGARVMLRSNINFEKGLVNGLIGNITEIIWPHFRRDQLYETDLPSVRIDFGRDGIHLIEPRSVQFPANYNQGTVERRMLPIILCWACTVHKMQGCTCDYAVVYLGKKLFAPGQAYVALSRVRSLDGLRIEELDCSKLTDPKSTCNEEAIAEMERMRHYQPPDDDDA